MFVLLFVIRLNQAAGPLIWKKNSAARFTEMFANKWKKVFSNICKQIYSNFIKKMYSMSLDGCTEMPKDINYSNLYRQMYSNVCRSMNSKVIGQLTINVCMQQKSSFCRLNDYPFWVKIERLYFVTFPNYTHWPF